MDKRQQINVRLDAETIAAIDDIRAMTRPIPTMSEVIRAAILHERDALRRRTERGAAR